jgi:hypothetical protein
VCLQIGEAEQATVAATGESVYKCNACAKSLGSSSNGKAPVKSPESLSHHDGATSCASPNEEASSLIISVSTQLEAVRLNGQCTIQLVESLRDMVSKLTKEITHLKNDNMLLKREIKNLHSLIDASPSPLLSTFLGSKAFCLRKCPTRTRPVSSACVQLTFHSGLACCSYTCRDDLD